VRVGEALSVPSFGRQTPGSVVLQDRLSESVTASRRLSLLATARARRMPTRNYFGRGWAKCGLTRVQNSSQ